MSYCGAAFSIVLAREKDDEEKNDDDGTDENGCCLQPLLLDRALVVSIPKGVDTLYRVVEDTEAGVKPRAMADRKARLTKQQLK